MMNFCWIAVGFASLDSRDQEGRPQIPNEKRSVACTWWKIEELAKALNPFGLWRSNLDNGGFHGSEKSADFEDTAENLVVIEHWKLKQGEFNVYNTLDWKFLAPKFIVQAYKPSSVPAQ